VLVAQLPHPNPWLVAVSLGYMAYYWGLSIWMTARGAGARREALRSVEGNQGD
jgi:phosphatidylcholine synthase